MTKLSDDEDQEFPSDPSDYLAQTQTQTDFLHFVDCIIIKGQSSFLIIPCSRMRRACVASWLAARVRCPYSYLNSYMYTVCIWT